MPVIGHGVEICTSTTRPTIGITAGTLIYETDTLSYRWYNGTTWLGLIPEGTVQPYGGSTAPTGWLLCAGQTLNSITSPEYAPLFSVIGITYGGSGASSFIIPDLRGRTVAGRDNMNGTAANRLTSPLSGSTLGAAGGDQRIQDHTHTFSGTTGNDSPDHSHTFAVYGGSFGDGAGAASWYTGFPVREYRASGGANSRHQHGFSGTTANHNQTSGGTGQNVQPTIILNYIIKF